MSTSLSPDDNQKALTVSLCENSPPLLLHLSTRDSPVWSSPPPSQYCLCFPSQLRVGVEQTWVGWNGKSNPFLIRCATLPGVVPSRVQPSALSEMSVNIKPWIECKGLETSEQRFGKYQTKLVKEKLFQSERKEVRTSSSSPQNAPESDAYVTRAFSSKWIRSISVCVSGGLERVILKSSANWADKLLWEDYLSLSLIRWLMGEEIFGPSFVCLNGNDKYSRFNWNGGWRPRDWK